MGATVVLTGGELPRLQINWCSWPQLQLRQKPMSTGEIQLETFYQQHFTFTLHYLEQHINLIQSILSRVNTSICKCLALGYLPI